jgi:hypothetical protein
MGGILSAEVALLPPYSPMSPDAFRHRILGTISFDTPFLGMHPGIITSGIASLFRSTPEPPNERVLARPDYLSVAGTSSDQLSTTGSMESSPFTSPTMDPHFDPPFPNDIRMQRRSGWENAMHFMYKHSDGLTRATKQYVTSHLEFGGCLADYPGLRRRYDRIRSLEDIDMHQRPRDQAGRLLRRVRFANYYTASTGRLKGASVKIQDKPVEVEMQNMNLSAVPTADGSTNGSRTHSPSPRISLEEHRDGQVVKKEVQDPDQEIRSVSPRPISDTDEPDNPPHSSQDAPQDTPPETPIDDPQTTSPLSTSFMDSLPPIPPSPTAPPEFDPSSHTDKDTLKLAKKEHTRLVKAYDRAKKDREKAIRDRQKLTEKREKAERKEADKKGKLVKKQQFIEEKEGIKRQATLNAATYEKAMQRDKEAELKTKAADGVGIGVPKKLRDRKFCVLPAKGRDGKRDPTWVRVFMEGVDEVGAHCGLFYMGETYEMLVGDVAGRIEEWVKEDATAAVVWEERAREKESEMSDYSYGREGKGEGLSGCG